MALCDKQADRYPAPLATAQKPHCSELLIKKSRFLAQSCEVTSAAAARSFIAATRTIRASASHNCWAFVAGPPGSTGCIGSSDDGEPHGTAGRPILEALLHSGIGRVCLVVSRWFGGIKLGTGGLARAYRQCALENLATLPHYEIRPSALWEVEVEYPKVEELRRLAARVEGRLENESYLELASFTLDVPNDRALEFRAGLTYLGALRFKGPLEKGEFPAGEGLPG